MLFIWREARARLYSLDNVGRPQYLLDHRKSIEELS